MAPTGPSDLLLLRSERSRQSSPRITVAPEAAMGAAAPRNALRIATVHRSSRCSSSLNRLISSSA